MDAALESLASALGFTPGAAALAAGAGAVLLVALVVLLLAGPSKPRDTRPAALHAGVPVDLPLIARTDVSHDTRRFRFGLPTPGHKLGLPVGQHVTMSFEGADGEPVERKYTPTSSDDDTGFVEFVVKVYKAGVHPKFPDGGVMSQHLESMQLGDTIRFEGPAGRITYAGKGAFHVKKLKSQGGGVEVRKAKNVGMIAGGTGITPMLQLLTAIFKDPADTTRVWLLFANQSEDDILVREELEAIQKAHPDRFHLWYTVDRPPSDWAYSSGFINAAMLREHMAPAGADTQICICGPPPMITYACKPAFKELGHKEENCLYW